MYNRHTTPPSSFHYLVPGSVGSDGTYHSQASSPEAHTATPTPPRSPVRSYGPTLLPKVRVQDQVAEPIAGPVRHRRTTSTSSGSYAYSPYSRPALMARRGSSPLNHNIPTLHSNVASPMSNASSYDFNLSTLNSPVTFPQPEVRRSSYVSSHSRSASANRARKDRSTSAGSVDDTVVSRYGFPPCIPRLRMPLILARLAPKT